MWAFSLAGADNSITNTAEWREMSLRVLEDDLPCVLVGTKCDLGTIDPTSIESICDTNNFHKWYITSSKTGEGVNYLFEDLTKVMIEYQIMKVEEAQNFKKSVVNLNDGRPTGRKCCPF